MGEEGSDWGLGWRRVEWRGERGDERVEATLVGEYGQSWRRSISGESEK